MAKVTERQKSNIIAKWNTGSYSKLQLAKAYKISDVMVGKIVGKEKPTNAHLVEAGVMLESVKKFENSSSEVQAINQAVKYELNSLEYKQKNIANVHEVSNDILDGIKKILKKGTAQKVITVGQGMGVSKSEVVEYEMQPEHFEKSANTVNKIAQNLGVLDTTTTKIDNSNNQQNKNDVNIVGYGVKTIEHKEKINAN